MQTFRWRGKIQVRARRRDTRSKGHLLSTICPKVHKPQELERLREHCVMTGDRFRRNPGFGVDVMRHSTD